MPSATHSPRPGSGFVARVAGAFFLALAVIAAAQYIAGYFFLWSYHLTPLAATPLTITRYAHFYGADQFVRRRLIICSCVGTALVGAAVVLALRRKAPALHGDARFATRREIAGAGLLANDGFILGEYGRRYLMLAGQQGVALAAPPRSGKGVSFVIPNLLNWPDSAIVTDIKLENWTITAGFRKACGQEVHLFAPLAEDGRTARWNPLSYVSADPEMRINGVQRIADMFYSETPGIDPFWIASARSLFVGIALYLFETPSLPKTIGEILRQGMVDVLLVEDDLAVRDATRMLLKAEGYRVMAVGSLAEALHKVREEHIDLLVTDYHLNDGETGTQVIAALRQILGFRLKAVLMTGDTSTEVRDLPRDGYLRIASKPIKAEELLTMLRALLAA